MALATTLAQKLLLLALVSSATTNLYPVRVRADEHAALDKVAWESGSMCIPQRVTVTATVYPTQWDNAWTDLGSNSQPSGWQRPDGHRASNGSDGAYGAIPGTGANSGPDANKGTGAYGGDGAQNGGSSYNNDDANGNDGAHGSDGAHGNDGYGNDGQQPGLQTSAAASPMVTPWTTPSNSQGRPNGKPSGTPNRGQFGSGNDGLGDDGNSGSM